MSDYVLAGVDLHAAMLRYLQLPVFQGMPVPELVVREPLHLGRLPGPLSKHRITIFRKHRRDLTPETRTASIVLNTLLHELAHLKAPLLEHHGPVWRAIFERAKAEAREALPTMTPDECARALLEEHGHRWEDFLVWEATQ